MIIWLRLFLPSPSRTGWGRQTEVNAQLLLCSSEPGAGRTHGSHRNRSLPPDGKVKSKASVSPPPRISPQASDLQSHASQDPLPSWRAARSHVEPDEGSSSLIVKKQCTTHQHAAASCMFSLGFIFMLNDSQELSVIFVPLVRPDQTPVVEVFFFLLKNDIQRHAHAALTRRAVLSSRRRPPKCDLASV